MEENEREEGREWMEKREEKLRERMELQISPLHMQ